MVLQLFAPKCKVIRERDTKSHARHIPFPVTTHTQRLTKDSHNTGNFMPCSFRIVCGFFNVPQWSYMNMEGMCETGPTVYRPYPRRSLTNCWFNYIGSTFYSVILRPWVLVQPESNSRPPSWQPDVPPPSHRYAVVKSSTTFSQEASAIFVCHTKEMLRNRYLIQFQYLYLCSLVYREHSVNAR